MHDTAERIRNGLSNAWESESGQIISRLEHTFPARVNVNKSRRKVLIFKIYNKHPCTMCDESFAFSSKLAIHILRHTGEKLHICTQCNKSFNEAGHLKRHLLSHSGEKPHKCVKCNKYFRQTGDLKKHFFTHHSHRRDVAQMCTMQQIIWSRWTSEEAPTDAQ